MKRPKFTPLLLLTLLATLQPAFASAATTSVTGGTNGPLCNSGGYFTPSSVTVSSGNTITFSVPANDPYAGGVQVNGFPQGSFVVSRGSSVTTQALSANVSYQGTWPGDPNCIKGSGTVQIASTPSQPVSTPPASGSGSPSSSTSKTGTTPAAAISPAANAQSTAVPNTVVADTITVAGEKITLPEGQSLTVNQSQPMALSGTTVPNGKITLTIHSKPITATVQASASGDWSYTVTSLPAGSHTIYAAVTDPATNQTSATSKLLAFTIKASSVASTARSTVKPMEKRSSALILTVASVAALLIIAAVATVVVKRGRTGPANTPEISPAITTPPATTQVDSTQASSNLNVSNSEEGHKEQS